MVSRTIWPSTSSGKMGKKMSANCADHALLPLNPWQSCEVDAINPSLQTKLKAEKGINLLKNSEEEPEPDPDHEQSGLFFPLYHTSLKTTLKLSGITLLEPSEKELWES